MTSTRNYVISFLIGLLIAAGVILTSATNGSAEEGDVNDEGWWGIKTGITYEDHRGIGDAGSANVTLAAEKDFGYIDAFDRPILTPPEAAALMENSIVQLALNGSGMCTATKIDDRRYLTAMHCVRGISTNYRLEFQDLTYLWPMSITIPLQEKTGGKDREDWAVINTTTSEDDIMALTIACDEEVYVGMPIATYGYGGNAGPNFSVGYVASLTHGGGGAWDFAIDVQSAPGASGSAIISGDTGGIIGVFIEGIMHPRAGAFLIGVQAITDLDVCGES